MTSTDPLQSVAPAGRTGRPWGWFEPLAGSPGNKINRMHLCAGQQISLQKYRSRDEHCVAVAGTARVTVGDRVKDLIVGQHADIAVGQVHRLTHAAALPLEIIEVQWGDDLGEDDIVRLHDACGHA